MVMRGVIITVTVREEEASEEHSIKTRIPWTKDKSVEDIAKYYMKKVIGH
jgi:hypothetical protein